MKKKLWKRILFSLLILMFALPVFQVKAEAKVILTGNKKIDLAAEAIIQRSTKPGMSQSQKLKACYAYLVNNMRYTHGGGSVRVKLSASEKKSCQAALDALKKSGNVKNSSKFKSDYRHLLTMSGTCKHMAGVLGIIANHLGYNAGYMRGRYVRGNGSSVEHWWSYIYVGGKKKHCDVQAANDISKKNKYNWYLKAGSSSYWRKHYRW